MKNESNYQPCRIRIFRDEGYEHTNRVAIFDMVRQVVIKVWHHRNGWKDPSPHPAHSPFDVCGRYDLALKDCLQIAKNQAAILNLPFRQASDIVSADDILEGEKRGCLICGKNDKRSRDNFICNPCLKIIAAGQMAAADKGEYGISTEFGYPLRLNREQGESLAHLICKLAGTSLGTSGFYLNLDRIGDPGGSFNTSYKWPITLTLDQKNALVELLNLIGAACQNNYTVGLEEGARFVQGIATGRYSVAEINEKEAGLSASRKKIDKDLSKWDGGDE